MSKLSLDRDKIDLARKLAEQIVSPILRNVERNTTVSIERSVLRLLGVEGTLEEKPTDEAPQGRYPLVNHVVDKLSPEALSKGVGYWFGLAALHNPKLTPSAVARKIAKGEIDVLKLEKAPLNRIDQVNQAMLAKSIQKLRSISEKRKKRPSFRISNQPLKYIIVATGNIHEDIWQAQAAAEMGADIIAVIRSTAQSLLDYVPEGETTEGFGGTFATQANFRLMRAALDESEKKLKRRIGLTNYSSGLCMAEIAVIGALEGVDYLLNDAMYGILFRDINMKRNFIDQNFARRICALSEITIQTGEDNYLTTADSHKYWYQVLASHFINHAFAKRAGLTDKDIALGHAFELDPWIEDSILYELGQAQLVREAFPKSPIKFMPPTKHKTGDIFFSYLYDGMFNLASILTGQSIHLLGMHTEAIHNPFVQDRFLSLKNAQYVFNGAKSIADEIVFQPNGKIVRRGRQVMDDAIRLLKKVSLRGLMPAISEGAFANVKRYMDSGRGANTNIEKDRDYYTPLGEYLTPKPKAPEKEELRAIRRSRMEDRRRARNDRGRRDNQRRPERGTDRPERGVEREDRISERADRVGRNDRVDRNEPRVDLNGRNDRNDRGGRGEGAGRADRGGRGDGAGRADRGGRGDSAGRADRGGRGDRGRRGRQEAPPPRRQTPPQERVARPVAGETITEIRAAVSETVIVLPPPGTNLETYRPPEPVSEPRVPSDAIPTDGNVAEASASPEAMGQPGQAPGGDYGDGQGPQRRARRRRGRGRRGRGRRPMGQGEDNRSADSTRGPGGDRPPGPEGQDRPERPERSDNRDRYDRPDRGERMDRTDRPDRPERPERVDRPDRPDRPDRADRPEPLRRRPLKREEGPGSSGGETPSPPAPPPPDKTEN